MKIHWSIFLAIIPFFTLLIENGYFPDEPEPYIQPLISTLVILFMAALLSWQRFRICSQEDRDPLTGLNHRNRFEEDLPREVARAERQQTPLTLACLDIDRFKTVIEKHGRSESESLLKGLAQVLLSSIRIEIDRCYRLGGDEFCVLMPNLDEQGTTTILDRFWEKTGQEPLALHKYGVGISMAVVTRHPGESSDSLLRRADLQMFETKRARRKAASNNQSAPG